MFISAPTACRHVGRWVYFIAFIQKNYIGRLPVICHTRGAERAGKRRFGRWLRLMLGSLKRGKMLFICGLSSA